MIVDNPALFEVIEKHAHLASAFKNSLPVQLIEPGDVSETVLFLAANDSGRYYTGSTLMVDAGMNIA
jgi:NAD(P)-dependent dehydrogenase (short-subunit alcohol dehydrogenase family)